MKIYKAYTLKIYEGCDNIKFLGIDFSTKDIFFETKEKQHIISFKIDFFGNIKDIEYAEDEKGSIVMGVKEIKVKSIKYTIFGRIVYLMDLTKEKIKAQLYRIYHMVSKKH